ncbi:MAG: hypothetical protein IJL98_06255, partial [Lachnospiraceae bacterium]|nr:hypothetical protein [Lachnospiraceae bacterium]
YYLSVIFTLQEVSSITIPATHFEIIGNKKRTAVKQQSAFVCQPAQTDAKVVLIQNFLMSTRHSRSLF